MVLGATIFEAFAKSTEFMKKFANVEYKTVKTKEHGSWQALYVRGENTYIELFDSFNNMPQGIIGIGFGLDKEGDLDRLYPYVTQFLKKQEIGTFTLEDDHLPLFRYLEFKSLGNSKINSFVIQYSKDTFRTMAFKHGRPKAANFGAKDVSRLRYNADAVDPNRLFKDIQKLEFAVDDEVLEGFHEIAASLDLNCLKDDGFEIKLKRQSVNSVIGVEISTTLFRSVHEPITMVETEGGILKLFGDEAIFAFL